MVRTMGKGFSLINLGELSKPATVLIEKIAALFGGFFEPYQIKRIAKAEAEAEKIKAVAEIEITDLHRRAIARFIAEEATKQTNIESITALALPELNDDARPGDIEDDWLLNFFDKSKLISDEEMQHLWAKVLAGEANAPGQYSKRTVNALSSFDKSDAKLFTQFCSFCWSDLRDMPMVYDYNDEIYKENGISFSALRHLDDIGLLKFEGSLEFARINLANVVVISYYGTRVWIKFNKEDDNEFKMGNVELTRIGEELSPITGAKPIPEFFEYVLKHWIEKGYVLSSVWPKEQPGGTP